MTERAIVKDALIERWISPDEIADAVWFLHNNQACTGVELAVDGGIGLKATLAIT
jgi:NAD(P)-dependent dehydrogenase (short-subunit alcohol dehydrogenase family)